MTAASKNVYIHKLDNIVDKYNNVYLRTIKIKPADVNSSEYFEFDVENYDKDPKIEFGDHFKIFAKGCTTNWSDEFFVIKNTKNTVLCTYVINDHNCEKRFTKKIWKRQIKQSFRVEEVIHKKVVIYLSSGKITIIHLTTGLIKR